MALETGTVIGDLDANAPSKDDQVGEGDDHLRLIKSILKTQFPGANGNGFNAQILANETELNYLRGCRDNVQDQIDDLGETLSAPAETQLTIRTPNNTVPLGWSRVTDSSQFGGRMMRIVTTDSPQGQGGQHNPIFNDRVPAHNHPGSTDFHNHSHSATVSNYNHSHGGTVSQESHQHDYVTLWDDPGNNEWAVDLAPPAPNVYAITWQTEPDTHSHTLNLDSNNHNHTVTNSSDSHDHVVNIGNNTENNTAWQPYYYDFMLIRKD